LLKVGNLFVDFVFCIFYVFLILVLHLMLHRAVFFIIA